jgi:hypothetical protein
VVERHPAAIRYEVCPVMNSARLLFILGLGSAACPPALAQDGQAWIGAPDCRLAAVRPAPAQAPSWSGACKDGYADGKGVLEWRNKDGKAFRLAASFVAGQVQGEGELHYPNDTVYTGSFKGNVPDGHAYVRYADGGQYEGDIRMGQREGAGEFLYPNGDDYKGQWRHGSREGFGEVSYGLGGHYEGGWKDGKPSGQGKVVYAGVPGREAATVDGREPNRPLAPAPGQTYTVKEDLARAGHLLRLDAAREIPVAPDRGYEQLSPDQQAIVNSWWPALAPGDEPPYPLHGPAEFYRLMSKIVSKTGKRGTILVYVTVGKEGKATGVRAVGLDDPEIRKVIAAAAAIVEYKPARCAGQPCAMTYPYHLGLTLE